MSETGRVEIAETEEPEAKDLMRLTGVDVRYTHNACPGAEAVGLAVRATRVLEVVSAVTGSDWLELLPTSDDGVSLSRREAGALAKLLANFSEHGTLVIGPAVVPVPAPAPAPVAETTERPEFLTDCDGGDV